MSCQQSATKVGKSGTVAAGISTLSSQVGNVAGNIAGRLAQTSDTLSTAVGKRVAPVSNKVLRAIDRPTTVAANLVPALATAAVYTQVKVGATGPAQGRRPAVAVAVGMRGAPDIAEKAKTMRQIRKGVGIAALTGGMAASVAADLTEKAADKRKLTRQKQTFLLGQQQVAVKFARSGLTGLLNKGDLLLSRRNVVSSQGDMVRHGSGLWHRGTTVVNTPQGKRTITHVRKMGLPSTSHYFDRALSDEEVAGLVSGQSKPYQMKGHVGTIGAMESLAPSWAQAKRAMILTRLHWPTAEKSTATGWVREKSQATSQVRPKPPPETVKPKKQVSDSARREKRDVVRISDE